MFSGAELRHRTQEIVIFAVGGPSEEASAVMRDAPKSVRVVWQEALYTQAELSGEALRILRQHIGRLTGAGPRNDGTGLAVTTTDEDLLRAKDPQLVLGARYPVAISFGEAVRPL